MSELNRVSLVIVDTCAFRDANSDFLGISKQLLPSFFSAIKEKGIVLLTHPVLDNEVRNHISDSGLYKDYQSLVTQLGRCNETLKRFSCYDELLYSKITKLDIRAEIYEAFKEHYSNAIQLDFGDPADVFALYFNNRPPFAATGKKKNEFPDAFVFDATKKFLHEHDNDILLVISKDNDWVTAFGELENVVICESVSSALTYINSIDSILSQEMIDQIFNGAYEDIISDAQWRIETECFELDCYETMTDLEIESVRVDKVDGNFTPLKITRDSILISTSITAKVTGHAEVFDEYNSVWDSVDHEYAYMSYADIDFTDATVEVECEVCISFDFDNPGDTAQVDSLKLLNRGNICICCEDALISQIDEEEMALRVLREDKGFPRRGIR